MGAVVNEHSEHVQACDPLLRCCPCQCCWSPSLWCPCPLPPSTCLQGGEAPPSAICLRISSRKPRLRMLRAKLPDLSPLLSLTEESRPPPTLLTTTMGLLLRLPMREPLSTHLSLRKDMDMLPLSTRLLLYTSLLLPTMLKKYSSIFI